VGCAARGGLQGRRPRDLRGRPGGGSSARLDPVGGAACTRRQQPTGPRSVFRASHLPLLRSAAAGSCSPPPPPASSSSSSAELLPAPANRQQRLASGWGESVRPPPMGGGVTSPDVGGRNGGRRWSGYGESCSPNVGWGGRLQGTVGGSLNTSKWRRVHSRSLRLESLASLRPRQAPPHRSPAAARDLRGASLPVAAQVGGAG